MKSMLQATVIKFIAIFCLIGMRTNAIYYAFLLGIVVRKFIGGGTLDSGLYRTKSCKGHLPSRAQTNGYRRSGELKDILLEIPMTARDPSECIQFCQGR